MECVSIWDLPETGVGAGAGVGAKQAGVNLGIQTRAFILENRFLNSTVILIREITKANDNTK